MFISNLKRTLFQDDVHQEDYYMRNQKETMMELNCYLEPQFLVALPVFVFTEHSFKEYGFRKDAIMQLMQVFPLCSSKVKSVLFSGKGHTCQ